MMLRGKEILIGTKQENEIPNDIKHDALKHFAM